MDDQRKDNIDSERPLQRSYPTQLQTYNVLTYHVEDTDSTNKERDLQLTNKLWIVTRGIERILQRIQRYRRATSSTSARQDKKF